MIIDVVLAGSATAPVWRISKWRKALTRAQIAVAVTGYHIDVSTAEIGLLVCILAYNGKKGADHRTFPE